MRNELTKFTHEELGEVRSIIINGEPMFVGRDIVTALGYDLSGKHVASEYIKRFCDKDDYILVDNNSPLHQGGVVNYKDLGQRGGLLISESGMYALIFSSDMDNAKKFKKWVTSEVLPSIRKYGAYIDNNEESVDQNYIKYSYGQLKETFTKCYIEELREEYDNCIKWYKNEKFRLPYANNSKRRKGSKHTITETREIVMSKISVVLESRSLELKELGKFGLASEIDDVIKIIKDNIGELNNRVNGGKLAGATKKIKKLEEILN